MLASQKVVLTDRRLKALKAAPEGERYMVWDGQQPHLAMRVTENGTRTFIVYKRANGRLVGITIGKYPAVPLATARKRAREILDTLAEGKHPREIEKEKQREEARRRRDTFASAVGTFLKDGPLDGLRTAAATEAVLRREFLGQTATRVQRSTERNGKPVTEFVREWSDGRDPIWRNRPVAEIKRRDVVERLDAIKARGGKHAARAALAAVRKFFAWCAEGERFGVEISPCIGVRDKTLGIKGRDLKRSHVLSDADLKDVWHTAEEFGYPFGHLVQLLMLLGQRRSDISKARRPELDLNAAMLRVPPERYKTGVAHEVPLPPIAVDIFKELPNFTGPYVFTTTGGRKPISGISKYSRRFDMALAERRAKEGHAQIAAWRLHDLRRTTRTRLADLGVDDFISERVIGHALPGLHQVYDQSTHREQKRAALEKWAARLMRIVGLTPEPGAAVVPAEELERQRRKRA